MQERTSPKKMSIFSLYDYVFGQKANIENNGYLASKKRKKSPLIPSNPEILKTPEQKTKKILTAEEIAEKKAIHLNTQKENKKKDFKELLDDETLSSIFRRQLRELNSAPLESLLFGNSTDPLPGRMPLDYALPTRKKIKAIFNEFNATYQFFDNDSEESFQQFYIFFVSCKLISDYFEQSYNLKSQAFRLFDRELTKPNNLDVKAIALQTYKILVLFGYNENGNPFRFLENYLIAHDCYNNPSPLLDILVTDLPSNSQETPLQDIVGWRKFIQTYGKKGISYAENAPQIENLLQHAPRDLEEAMSASAQLLYSRYSEYPELATLCFQYERSEKVFNKCLEIEKKRKSSDKLPEVCIQGKTIGHLDYALVKLPIDDPKAYLLGMIVNCSLRIGGHSEACVIDGLTLENNGFYVLLKCKKTSDTLGSPYVNNKINYKAFNMVGVYYTTLSQRGNLTIDSLENLRHLDDDPIAVALLKEWGPRVTNEHSEIMQITIGHGANNQNHPSPGCFTKEDSLTIPERVAEGLQYDDSTYQYLVYLNKEKQDALRNNLVEQSKAHTWFWKDEQEFIKLTFADELSHKQAEWIKTLLLQLNSEKFFTDILNQLNVSMPDFKEYIQQKGLLIWNTFYQMHQAGILNSTNLQSLLDIQFNYTINPIPQLTTALILFNKMGILNMVNFQMLIKNPFYSYEISKALVILHKADILNEVNRNALIHYYEEEISLALVALKNATILNDCTRDLLSKNAKNAEDLAVSIITLHKATILEDTLELLLKNVENARTFNPIIVTLQSLKILSKENFKQILMLKVSDAENIRMIVNILEKAKILDDLNFNIIIKNSDALFEIKLLLAILQPAGILSQTNFETCVQYASFADKIKEALDILQKARILNNANFQIILSGELGPLPIAKSLTHCNNEIKKINAFISRLQEKTAQGFFPPNVEEEIKVLENLKDHILYSYSVKANTNISQAIDSFKKNDKYHAFLKGDSGGVISKFLDDLQKNSLGVIEESIAVNALGM